MNDRLTRIRPVLFLASSTTKNMSPLNSIWLLPCWVKFLWVLALTPPVILWKALEMLMAMLLVPLLLLPPKSLLLLKLPPPLLIKSPPKPLKLPSHRLHPPLPQPLPRSRTHPRPHPLPHPLSSMMLTLSSLSSYKLVVRR